MRFQWEYANQLSLITFYQTWGSKTWESQQILRNDDNLMYFNPTYMLTAYSFPIWILEKQLACIKKKERERGREREQRANKPFVIQRFPNAKTSIWMKDRQT